VEKIHLKYWISFSKIKFLEDKDLDIILARQRHVEAKLQNIDNILANVIIIRTIEEQFHVMID